MASSSSGRLIADAIGSEPAATLCAGGVVLSRWRKPIASYRLPPLPDTVFALHWAGRPRFSVWTKAGWSGPICKQGTVSCIPAGTETGWRINGVLDAITISLPPQSATRDRRFAIAEPNLLAVELGREIMDQMRAARTQSREDYIGLLVRTLSAHLTQADSGAPGPAHSCSPSEWRIREIEAHIRCNPAQACNVDDLAERAGLAPSHFSRLFKSLIGQPPHRYVCGVRLERSSTMLATTDLPVGEIAALLGFASQSHFTRTFSKQFGEPPLAYRRRSRVKVA